MQAAVAFEESFDVVVVGYGGAGAFAALAAAETGANVLVLEKAPNPGGITLCSFGSVRSASDADKAFAYLKATNAGRTPDEALRPLAEGMAKVEQQLRDLAAKVGARVDTRDARTCYLAFPGNETFYDTLVTEVPGHSDSSTAYPHLHISGSLKACGWRLFKVLEDNIALHDVEVRLSAAAERFILDAEGRIAGLVARHADGRTVRIEARRGVVLACGGFEASDEMKRQYWQMEPVLPVASYSNTGDGIRMAQQVGADLWHMWHQHGVYGFRHPDPDVKLGIRAKGLPTWVPGKEEQASVGMSWIVLDQDGRRYMNEHHPYAQDTNARPMELFDPMRQRFPRIPSYMIIDEKSRKMYPVGVPTFNQVGVAYEWSDDNSKEIENGMLRRADTIEDLAALLGVEVGVVRETLDRWNESCRAGSDRDFGRPTGTLVALENPPYYIAELWPVVTNTQGGPRHDARQRVIDVFGNPIPNLWAAGETGSVFGYLYLAGGNLAECAVGGTIAGHEAGRNVKAAKKSAA